MGLFSRGSRPQQPFFMHTPMTTIPYSSYPGTIHANSILSDAYLHHSQPAGLSHYHKPIQEQYFEAIENGNIHTLTHILNSHPDLLYKKNSKGDSGLIRAIASDQHCVFDFLLNKGGTYLANLQNNNGWTPFLYVIHKGEEELFNKLVKVGANTHHTIICGYGALAVAATAGQTCILKQLLDMGFDPNITTDKNETPLMWAAKADQISAVRTLLNCGADINIISHSGKRADAFTQNEGIKCLIRDFLYKRHGFPEIHTRAPFHAPQSTHLVPLTSMWPQPGTGNVYQGLDVSTFDNHLGAKL